MNALQMLSSHPRAGQNPSQPLARCVDECYACAQVCESCADACLGEEDVTRLSQCIRLDLDCAHICLATGAIATRRTGSNEEVLIELLEVCSLACRKCAEECEQHAAKHEHCRLCAEQCRSCERACVAAMEDVGGKSGRVQTN